jgi:hypothetical protein
MNTLQFNMFTSGIFIHCVGWGYLSPNAVVNGNFVFDLCSFVVRIVSQEHNSAVKWDLRVFYYDIYFKQP